MSAHDVAACRGEHCNVRMSCDRYLRPTAAIGQTWLVIPAHEQGAGCRHQTRVVRQESDGDAD